MLRQDIKKFWAISLWFLLLWLVVEIVLRNYNLSFILDFVYKTLGTFLLGWWIVGIAEFFSLKKYNHSCIYLPDRSHIDAR